MPNKKLEANERLEANEKLEVNEKPAIAFSKARLASAPVSALVSERVRKCPLCAKPRVEVYKPFCSRACRDRDFLNWFGEAYPFAGG